MEAGLLTWFRELQAVALANSPRGAEFRAHWDLLLTQTWPDPTAPPSSSTGGATSDSSWDNAELPLVIQVIRRLGAFGPYLRNMRFARECRVLDCLHLLHSTDTDAWDFLSSPDALPQELQRGMMGGWV